MQFARRNDRYVVRLDRDEDVSDVLVTFLKDQNIFAGSIQCIGAVRDAHLSFYDTQTREYKKRRFAGDYEVLSLSGNIAAKKGAPFPHMHAILSGPDCVAFGGHFHSATVSVTLECIIDKLEGPLAREYDESTGLHLLSL